MCEQHGYTTLENRMKCGLGECGRCNTGKSYVCKDGPVYTLAELEQLPAEYRGARPPVCGAASAPAATPPSVRWPSPVPEALVEEPAPQ